MRFKLSLLRISAPADEFNLRHNWQKDFHGGFTDSIAFLQTIKEEEDSAGQAGQLPIDNVRFTNSFTYKKKKAGKSWVG